MVTDFKKQGKKNRAAGAKFEKKVRAKFEEEGWIVDKWTNNMDLDCEEIIHCKQHYIPGRGNTLGHGFPDFIMFRRNWNPLEFEFELIFVECKLNGKLKKEEKEKCKVLQEKGNKVYIAYEDISMKDKIRLREFVYSEKRDLIPRGKE